jgi:excisionase family DNA binding protein
MDTPNLPPKRGYHVKEATRYTGLCASTLSKLVREGRLASVKVGKRRLFTVEALEKIWDPPEKTMK